MSFLYPQIFVYIFLPSLILFFFLITSKSKFIKIFSDEVYKKLTLTKNSSLGRNSRITLLFLALFLMILAFARPVVQKQDKEIVAKGSEIVIGLDISLSMDATDIYPSRLKASIHKIKKLLEEIKHDKVAVVAFAKDSYIVSPMTKDKKIVTYLLDDMDISRFKNRSSNMPAIIEAVKMLSSVENPTLLILSDGDEGELKEIEEEAKENGIRLYAIGMATDEGVPIPDGNGGYINNKDGNIVISGINPHLKDIALSSGGAYTDFTTSADDILAIFKQIKKDIKTNEFEKEKIKDYQEFFYFPLGGAILLLLVAFYSLPSRAVVIAIFILIVPIDMHSASFDFEHMEKAKEAYSSGKYDEAIKSYELVRGLGDDSEAKRLYNIGNSNFRLGKFDEAIKNYEDSLELNEDEDTKYNLNLAKKRKQEKEKKEEENNKDKDGDDKQKQDDDKKKDKDSKDKNDKKQKDKEKKDKESEKSSEQSKDKKSEEKNKSEKNEKMNDKKQMSDMEEQRWLKELNKKPNPMPLKALPLSKGDTNANTW